MTYTWAFESMSDTIDITDLDNRYGELVDMLADGTGFDVQDRYDFHALKELLESSEYDSFYEWARNTGGTLIRYNYTDEYLRDEANELRPELEYLPSWVEIDWDKTCENLLMDYTSVDYDGIAFYYSY